MGKTQAWVHLMNPKTGEKTVVELTASATPEDARDALEAAKREGFVPTRTERRFEDEGGPRGIRTTSAHLRVA